VIYAVIIAWPKNGIDAALDAGLKIKINTVALKGTNADEIPDLMRWAHSKAMDMTLIEVMPMGEIDEDRVDQYLPLTEIRDVLDVKFTLSETPYRTGGPSRRGSRHYAPPYVGDWRVVIT